MAGDWIKFEVATPEKPEVWQIADDLDIDPDAVIGKLMRLWVWFDQHTEDGNAPIVTKKLLDRSVGVIGFCDSVVAVGWMEETPITIGLPNFERHNGKTAKNRALTAKRVASHKAKTNAEGNGKVTPEPLPKEEKRREEEKDSKPSSPAKGKIQFDTFIKQVKESGERPIPDNHEVIRYADAAGIPQEYLKICWEHFKSRYAGTTKRYVDWRKAFSNCVRENWFKLWWHDGENYNLTSLGQQALTALNNKREPK